MGWMIYVFALCWCWAELRLPCALTKSRWRLCWVCWIVRFGVGIAIAALLALNR